MAGFRQRTPHKKAVVVSLQEEVLPTRDIAIELHCNQSMLVRLLKKLAEKGIVAWKVGTVVKPMSIPGQDQILK
jgi:DNA-binding HxlR family transcriptional regulator